MKKEEEINEKEIDSNNLHLLGYENNKKDLPLVNASFYSNKLFSELNISENTKKSIKDVLKFQFLTHIQDKTIDILLKGRDLLGSAKTGSGKTWAFMIPVIENLYKIKFEQKHGTGAIIITPTRELAQQIYNVTQDLLSFHNKTLGLLIGGGNRKLEKIKLQKGVNIIVATPGRLLDHLRDTKFTFHNLINLVIDEADQILKIGFEEEINQILKILPTDRQTILFSATQTKNIDDLVRLSMKSPKYIGVDDNSKISTVQNLEQGYLICEPDLRFRILYTFLKKNLNKKIMVFFSSCNSVKFHSDLLNYVDIRVWDIHGKQKQQKRLNTFYEFCNLEKGILLCTDVASRGLDIPSVDWIIQYDPPDDVKEYIHRVGRTCRGSDTKGKALLFLLKNEISYLKHLENAKVILNEYEFLPEKLADMQNKYEVLVEKNYHLFNLAKYAYKSYLHAYVSHSAKEIFNVNEIDLKKISRSFGLKNPPVVDLNVNFSSKRSRNYKTQEMLLKNKKKSIYFNNKKNN